MKEINVRIVQLEPLHVASAFGFGPSPEAIAWEKLLTWARAKELLAGDTSSERIENGTQHGVRFFGFNNPSPSPGSPNYGYEQWMTVAPEVQGEGDITIKDFSGGLYAVTRCELRNIEATWQALMAWCEAGPHRWAPNHHQWLEEAITPPVEGNTGEAEALLDLYLPLLE